MTKLGEVLSGREGEGRGLLSEGKEIDETPRRDRRIDITPSLIRT